MNGRLPADRSAFPRTRPDAANRTAQVSSEQLEEASQAFPIGVCRIAAARVTLVQLKLLEQAVQKLQPCAQWVDPPWRSTLSASPYSAARPKSSSTDGRPPVSAKGI